MLICTVLLNVNLSSLQRTLHDPFLKIHLISPLKWNSRTAERQLSLVSRKPSASTATGKKTQ